MILTFFKLLPFIQARSRDSDFRIRHYSDTLEKRDYFPPKPYFRERSPLRRPDWRDGSDHPDRFHQRPWQGHRHDRFDVSSSREPFHFQQGYGEVDRVLDDIFQRISDRQIKDAIADYKRKKNPGIRPINKILNLLCNAKLYNEAEALYHAIPECDRNTFIYGTILKIYRFSKQYDKAETLFSSIPLGVRNVVVCNTMLTIYGDNAKYDQAVALYNSIDDRSRDIVTYNTMLKIYGDNRKWSEAERLFTSIPLREQTIITKVTMLKIYGDSRQYDQAVALYNAIDDRSRNLNTYNTMLKVHGDNGKYDQAVALYNSIDDRSRDIVTYNTMLKIYGYNQKWSEADRLFSSIPLRKRTIITNNTMLKIYGDSRQYDKAVEVYNSIDDRTRNLSTYNTMLKIYGDMGDYRKAIYFYSSISVSDKNEVTYGIMLKIYGDMGDYRKAIDFYSSIPVSDKNEVTYGTMLKIYGDNGRYGEAERLFESIPSEKQSIVTCNTMLKIYGDMGDYRKAIVFYGGIPEHERNVVTYTMMLKIYGDMGDYRKAIAFYEGIPVGNKNEMTYGTMLKIYGDNGRYVEAERLFESIPLEKRNIVTYNTMLKIYGDMGDYENARQLVRGMDRPDLVSRVLLRRIERLEQSALEDQPVDLGALVAEMAGLVEEDEMLLEPEGIPDLEPIPDDLAPMEVGVLVPEGIPDLEPIPDDLASMEVGVLVPEGIPDLESIPDDLASMEVGVLASELGPNEVRFTPHSVDHLGNRYDRVDLQVVVPIRLPRDEGLDLSPQEIVSQWCKNLKALKFNGRVQLLMSANTPSSQHNESDEGIYRNELNVIQKIIRESGLNISVNVIWTSWETKDNQVPYGAFRQQLLELPDRVASTLLICMDADTCLNTELIRHILDNANRDSELEYVSYPYRLDFAEAQGFRVHANLLDVKLRKSVAWHDKESNTHCPATYFSEACQVFAGQRTGDIGREYRYAPFGMDGASLRRSIENGTRVRPKVVPDLASKYMPLVTNVRRFDGSNNAKSLYTLPESHANPHNMGNRIASELSLQSHKVHKLMGMFSPWKLLKNGMSLSTLKAYTDALEHFSTRGMSRGEDMDLNAFFEEADELPDMKLMSYVKSIVGVRGDLSNGWLTGLRLMVKWSRTITNYLMTNLNDDERRALLVELGANAELGNGNEKVKSDVFFGRRSGVRADHHFPARKTASRARKQAVRRALQNTRGISPPPLEDTSVELDGSIEPPLLAARPVSAAVPMLTVDHQAAVAAPTVWTPVPVAGAPSSDEIPESSQDQLRHLIRTNKKAKSLFEIIIPEQVGIQTLLNQSELIQAVERKMQELQLPVNLQGLCSFISGVL